MTKPDKIIIGVMLAALVAVVVYGAHSQGSSLVSFGDTQDALPPFKSSGNAILPRTSTKDFALGSSTATSSAPFSWNTGPNLLTVQNVTVTGTCTGCGGGGSAFNGLLTHTVPGATTPHITDLLFDNGMFDFANVASAGTVKLDWTNGPASRSTANTWALLQSFSSSIALNAGAGSTPALRFTGDTDSGIYSNAGNQLGIVVGGGDADSATLLLGKTSFFPSRGDSTVAVNLGSTGNNRWNGIFAISASLSSGEFTSYASASSYTGAAFTGVGTCTGTTFLQWAAGAFSCGTPSGGGSFSGLLMHDLPAVTTPHISDLLYDAGMFNFTNVASAGTLRLDWTNGPASRSAANTWSALNTFNAGASVSPSFSIGGTASSTISWYPNSSIKGQGTFHIEAGPTGALGSESLGFSNSNWVNIFNIASTGAQTITAAGLDTQNALRINVPNANYTGAGLLISRIGANNAASISGTGNLEYSGYASSSGRFQNIVTLSATVPGLYGVTSTVTGTTANSGGAAIRGFNQQTDSTGSGNRMSGYFYTTGATGAAGYRGIGTVSWTNSSNATLNITGGIWAGTSVASGKASQTWGGAFGAGAGTARNGVYSYLNDTLSVSGADTTGLPTFTGVSALVADNRTVAADIFEARDNTANIFRIKDGGDIQASGSFVGFGGASLSVNFEVKGYASASTYYGPNITSTNNGNYLCWNTTTFVFEQNVAACLVSNRDYKTNIQKSPYGLNDLLKVPTFQFYYKKGYGDSGAVPHIGMMAQDVQKAMPLLGVYNADGTVNSYDTNGMLSVHTQAILDLNQKIEDLAQGKPLGGLGSGTPTAKQVWLTLLSGVVGVYIVYNELSKRRIMRRVALLEAR